LLVLSRRHGHAVAAPRSPKPVAVRRG
jgi:hypothetical protein